MFWGILFGGLFFLCLAIFYLLVRSVQKFHFVFVLSHKGKIASWLLSATIILLPFAFIWMTWGYMNAIIILLHFAVFWSIAACVQWVVQKRRKKSFCRYYAGIAAVLVTILYLGMGFIQAHHVWQTDYTVTTVKNVGSLRIALLADSHVGTTFDGKGMASYIARIQEQKPDVIVIAGDFVDEDTSREDMVAACQALGQADTPYGIYYIFGNHDKGLYANGQRGYNGDDLIAELEKNGVIVLQDEIVLIDDRFYLVGRQDASEETDFGGRRAKIADLTKNLDKDTYTIVLDHQPNDYDAEAASGADLVLSGHTHGGQMIPLKQLMRLFPIGYDNVYGLERKEKTNFIVTSGISDWAIQFKTGCRSEYVMITIQGK